MKLLNKLDLTPQKIIPATIAIILSSIIIITGYYFGIQLLTGMPVETDWVEKDVTLESVLTEEDASLNMMLSHLKVISNERHTTNSEELDSVREYLCEQFEIMGYEYKIIEDTYEGTELAVLDMQHHMGMSKEDAMDEKERKSGTFKHYYSEHYRENYEEGEILPVKHLLVRIVPEKVSNEKAVLVMSHFDSTSSSTNTANGGMSVASILGAETLLNDYVELADNVEYVLNFTGYGPEGNQFLICTNDYNSAILEHLKNAGFQGLDFAAVIDSNEYYNTMHDSIENLDRGYANASLYNITTLISYCATTETNSISLSDGTVSKGVKSGRDTLLFTLPFFKQVTVPAKQLQIIHLITIAIIILLVLILQKVTNYVKTDSNPSEFVAYIGGGLLVVILSAYIFDRTIFLAVDWSIRGYLLIPIAFTALYIFTKALGFKKGEVGTFWCLFVFLGALSILTTLLIPELSEQS